VGQSYELPISYAFQDAAGWARIATDFHAAHRQRFGHADAEAPMEIVGFGATAVGKVDTPILPELPPGEPSPPAGARIGSREVFFESDTLGEAGAWFATKVFERQKLLAGNAIEGPAVIEEISATTVLYPGDCAQVHTNGALIVECRP
jgi:N-methylhydantoinase A